MDSVSNVVNLGITQQIVPRGFHKVETHLEHQKEAQKDLIDLGKAKASPINQTKRPKISTRMHLYELFLPMDPNPKMRIMMITKTMT